MKPERIGLAEPEERGIFRGLAVIGDRLAAGERRATKPRPMNSMVSVAMKAGTRRTVTSMPLMSPIASAEQQAPERPPRTDAEVEIGRRESDREDDGDQAVESSRPTGRGPC